jgi:hypothetical protein
VDVQQVKHVLGPAAYAALALELDHPGDPGIADGEIGWAIESAPEEVREILLHMPAYQARNSRINAILYQMDAGIRSRSTPWGS